MRRSSLNRALPLAAKRAIAAEDLELVDERGSQQVLLYHCDAEGLAALGARSRGAAGVRCKHGYALAAEDVLARGGHDRLREDIHADGAAEMLRDATSLHKGPLRQLLNRLYVFGDALLLLTSTGRHVCDFVFLSKFELEFIIEFIVLAA